MDIQAKINQLHKNLSSDLRGSPSQAFPGLSLGNPDTFGISVATTKGEFFHVGDCEEDFTIQSISKPFTYGLALDQHGIGYVETKVSVEPTGDDYDSIFKLDRHRRPYNPMVNTGAIVTTSLVTPGKFSNSSDEIVSYFSKFAGRDLEVNDLIYFSEKENSNKNWAIAHLLRHFNLLSGSFKEDLATYFRQCSISLNTKDLALMGATLANVGINPLTKEKCISKENLRNVLSVLFTCGMYNYSGEWMFDVGLPAKSGISGSILMVVPNVMGIAVYSPRLDKIGNSIRGIQVCEAISEYYGLHILEVASPDRLKMFDEDP